MDATIFYSSPQAAYLPGEVIERDVSSVDGSPLVRWRFTIGPSPGSGFAGQVYRASVDQPGPFPARVAIKVLRPRSPWKNLFREMLFGLGFQTAFAPRLCEEAVQAGLLWQTILRAAVGEAFGCPSAVARPYGYFWEPELASFAEVHEWVPGRPARCEPDENLLAGLFGRPIPAPATEMARKKVFMDALANLCRRLGAPGLARQYDWYTMVSQANVLTLAGDAASHDESPGELVAVDCRPGLAIPFFLPVSPSHARIILSGLRRGRLVHYDEVDLTRLSAYLDAHPGLADLRPLVEKLARVDAAYRGGLPDLWHTRTRLLRDRAFRAQVCRALVNGWQRTGLADPQTASRLPGRPLACLLLGMLALLPLLGTWLVRLLAHSGYRRHLSAMLSRREYRRAALLAWRSRDLPAWQAEGRIPPARAAHLSESLPAYAAEKLFLALLPPALHRLLVDPRAIREWARLRLIQPISLLVSQAARVHWLEGILQYQCERGVIPTDKAADLLGQLGEPRMQGFIRDMGLAAGLDVISRLVYLILGVYGLSSGRFLLLGLALLLPISPSGVVRFFYVLARLALELPAILRRRDPGHPPARLLMARVAALLVAPWRWVGNLFPLLEISAVYTRLAFVLAEYYAGRIADAVPVYGGEGRLLAYWVFQLTFSLPLSLKRELDFCG